MIKAPKGTKDILPKDSYKWQYIENIMRKVCKSNCIKEARTPVFEHTELFLRGVGEVTDIVQKEMYTFLDKGERSISLKPEGTAGIARMFIENGLFNEPLPIKQYYVANPIFRYENPQSGRLREHHQFGVEIFGAASAMTDAEAINVALTVFEELKVSNLSLNINSIGCPNCRPKYNEALTDYLNNVKDGLCKTCNLRLTQNPLRILDCKEDGCKELIKDAPIILDYLCDDCSSHFHELQENLAALDIEYTINPMIVRGLDYYTKTVFEIISNEIGSQGTVCGGGRYDKLISEIGGPDTPAVGFGMGMERLLLVMENCNIEIPQDKACTAYICSMNRECEIFGIKIAKTLRDLGISTEINHGGRSVKAQFKYANKLNCNYVITIGEDELETKVLNIKDMTNGEINNIHVDKLKDFFNII